MPRQQESLTAPYEARTEQLPAQVDMRQWTYDDYARLPDDGWRYEVIRGELYLSPAPRPLHQRVLFRISRFLDEYLEETGMGTGYCAPIDVILPGKRGAPVQPDIVVIRRERLHIVGERNIQGAPDLVMEALSPSNQDHDRSLKYEIYAEAGVSEYWILDPDAGTVEVYVLRGNAYELLGRFDEDGTARSETLDGFTLSVNEIIRT